MKRSHKILTLTLSAVLFALLPALFAPLAATQQQGGPYTLHPTVVAGGGGSSTGGANRLDGTIGQGILGTSSGGSFTLHAGFWQAEAPCAAPAISSQPTNETACAGSAASFLVTASGTISGFQWRKNGVNLTNGGNISGATSATLTINPATATDAASYDVVINGLCGNATSDAATLTVNSYSLSSNSQSVPASGGNFSVDVLVAGSCPWTAVSNDSFIAVVPPSNGNGNGTVNYAVANNLGGARTGTLTIAGLTFIVNQSGPTAITLEFFTATAYGDGTLLEWQTGFEVSNLGFRIHREEAGKRALVNRELVAGSALTAGSATTLTSGKSYAFWEEKSLESSESADSQNVAYWLEDVDLSGQSFWHGPFYAETAKGKRRKAKGKSARLADIGVDRSVQSKTMVAEPKAELVFNRPIKPSLLHEPAALDLASSRAVKIGVRQAGWYRLSQAELVHAGLSKDAKPQGLQLFVDGKELPILVTGEEDGNFDPSDVIEFHGIGLDTPSTDTRIYWLTEGARPGLRIEKAPAAKGAALNDSFAYTVERRDRSVYFSALLNGDEENFFGAIVTNTELEQQLSIDHVQIASPLDASLQVSLQGVTMPAHQVNVQLNGRFVGSLNFTGQSKGEGKFEVPHSLLREDANIVSLQTLNGASDVVLVDLLRLTYQHTYEAEHDCLNLTAQGGEQLTVAGFSEKNVRVFDVTDERDVLELTAEIEKSKDGYAATFTATRQGERRLLILNENKFLRPTRLGANHSSSWRHAPQAADFLIISHAEFVEALKPLVELRHAQGLRVAVVDVEDIYDEFSYGHKSLRSLKDFIGYAATNWRIKPRFVLLMGDASYDPKNYLGLGAGDFVPTKLIDTNYLETASDDWLADFDDDGVADLSVGRLPVRTSEEATLMVSKILASEKATPSQELMLVADENDGFDFEAANNQLASLVPPNVNVNRVNRGRVDSETAKKILLDGIHRGQKVVNYTGHGSVNQWRGGLLNAVEARSLINDHLPLFVMMTCLNGYFHDAEIDSLSEALLKAENGGAVAVWASTGMTQPVGQAEMNRELFRQLFSGMAPQQGTERLGEVIRRAKAAIADADVRRTWVLLGDPTVRLRLTR